MVPAEASPSVKGYDATGAVIELQIGTSRDVQLLTAIEVIASIPVKMRAGHIATDWPKHIVWFWLEPRT